MSMQYCLSTIGQPSFYNPLVRKLEIEFDIPDKISEKEKPGIVLLISGFGGHYQSNVYKKMRHLFADENNYITIQCNYFGTEFMQSVVREETSDNFCDMGPIQAMDNLIALRCLVDFLNENSIPYDNTNVIAYGHSHGGYLALLMNAFMPGVLSCIIDNSAWLFPAYIDNGRYLSFCDENGDRKEQIFNYLISKIIADREIYSLNKLYSDLENFARIICFHGLSDSLVSPVEKCAFISQIPNASIELIGLKRVDGKLFKSSSHALDADFLEMFYYVNDRYNTRSDSPVLNFVDRSFETDFANYCISNEDGIPILYCIPK